MKISSTISLFVLILLAPITGISAYGWNSSKAMADEIELSANINKAAVSTRTLKKIIREERRFVLFNSRRLNGECLSTCEAEVEAGTQNPINEPTDKPSITPTKSPTDRPSKNPTKSPTDIPSVTPTKSPTDKPSVSPTVTPTKSPTDKPSVSPTNSPTKSPTASPTKSPTDKPSVTPTTSPTCKPVCDDQQENLGDGFSAATGVGGYSSEQCYPPIVQLDANNLAGIDDSVAVFVGGSYYGRRAAEVEGNMVVLGDLSVDSNGPGNFVSVGVGTHVLPTSGGECIKVGGSISAARDIQVFNQVQSMYCDIVYKGSATNKNRWKTNGSVRRDPDLDLSEYEKMKTVLAEKSKYWSTLPSTGQVIYESWGNPTGQTTYECGSEDVQVFNIFPNEREKIEGVHTIYFSKSCLDKTILINVHGDGNRNIDAAAMLYEGKMGFGPGGFPTCITSSMLWNFPDADSVDIGNGRTSEFHGSVLITGDMTLSTSGQSGRTMVLGDIIHDSDSGSEFHSYEFNPPTSLPNPACVDESTQALTESSVKALEAPTKYESAQALTESSVKPLVSPTKSPKKSPTTASASSAPSKCTAIPQNRLPSGSWKTTNSNCNKCKPPNNKKWWPCNLNPPICEGNCIFK